MRQALLAMHPSDLPVAKSRSICATWVNDLPPPPHTPDPVSGIAPATQQFSLCHEQVSPVSWQKDTNSSQWAQTVGCECWRGTICPTCCKDSTANTTLEDHDANSRLETALLLSRSTPYQSSQPQSSTKSWESFYWLMYVSLMCYHVFC